MKLNVIFDISACGNHLVDNFGKQQADNLIRILKSNGIFAYAKESGLGNMSGIRSGHNTEDRFVVIINERDSQQAVRLLNRFREDWDQKLKEVETVCPTCNRKLTVIFRKLNFFQRIIYAGTKPKTCSYCHTNGV